MSSNLRAKAIQGHVADSAGNVLRNSQIIIKQSAPLGSITIDRVISDDDGYFKTSPLPNGIYDIYESGVNIARIIHTADRNAIQCFKPNRDNYDISLVEDFVTLKDLNELNGFKYFLQIEQEEVDVSVLGSSFPIYNFDIIGTVDPTNELYNMADFFNFTPASRITTTRFDIEYFAPLTELSNNYKRIRWAGVPGLRLSEDSKLVVPLDYFSIVASLPKFVYNFERVGQYNTRRG